jgi:hypothetical protein
MCMRCRQNPSILPGFAKSSELWRLGKMLSLHPGLHSFYLFHYGRLPHFFFKIFYSIFCNFYSRSGSEFLKIHFLTDDSRSRCLDHMLLSHNNIYWYDSSSLTRKNHWRFTRMHRCEKCQGTMLLDREIDMESGMSLLVLWCINCGLRKQAERAPIPLIEV